MTDEEMKCWIDVYTRSLLAGQGVDSYKLRPTNAAPAPVAEKVEPESNWDRIKVGERWGFEDDGEPWQILQVSPLGFRATGATLRGTGIWYYRGNQTDEALVASYVRHPDAPMQPKALLCSYPIGSDEDPCLLDKGHAGRHSRTASPVQPKAVEPAAAKPVEVAKVPTCKWDKDPEPCKEPRSYGSGLCMFHWLLVEGRSKPAPDAPPAPRVLPYVVGDPLRAMLHGPGSATVCPVRSRRPRS